VGLINRLICVSSGLKEEVRSIKLKDILIIHILVRVRLSLVTLVLIVVLRC
jgi:hypothetical protein